MCCLYLSFGFTSAGGKERIFGYSSYYSETKDEIPLKIAPNAIPHYTSPSMNIGSISAYSVIYPIYKK